MRFLHGLLLVTALASALAESHPKLMFTSCALPGWSCINSTDGLSSSIASVTYKCGPTTIEKTRLSIRPSTKNRRNHGYNYYESDTETYMEAYTETIQKRGNYTLTLADWEKLPLTSVTISGCDEIVLNMHTYSPLKIHTLRIDDLTKLILNRPTAEQRNHPQNIIFKDIDFIPVIPAGFLAFTDTKNIEFEHITIGLIKTKAISLKTPLESFKWTVVTTRDMRARSMSVKMQDEAQFLIRDSAFPFLRTASILVEGGETLVENSRFNMIQHASIRIYSSLVKFSKNLFTNHQGHLFIVSSDVSFLGNTFENAEPKSLIKWTTHTAGDNPEQVTFQFTENKVDLPEEEEINDFGSLEECRSRTIYLEHASNCSQARNEPSGLWMYNMPKNLTVSNLIVCNNKCIASTPSQDDTDVTNKDIACRIPYTWDVVNAWPNPICMEDAVTAAPTLSAPAAIQMTTAQP